MSVETIAEAVWVYATRTLSEGSAATPTTVAGWTAKAVWEYATRTLTEDTALLIVDPIFLFPVER